MKLISTSACPHDCPSTCTLDIEHDDNSIFKINGNKENSYTKGVICAKVSRYRERTHSKKRLYYPMKRIGKKGQGLFEEISWNQAINLFVEKIKEITLKYGSNSIWPYFYAGTMGLLTVRLMTLSFLILDTHHILRKEDFLSAGLILIQLAC